MSRHNCGTHAETRSSALWGTGNRGGDSRANALWGKGGRGFAVILAVLAVTAVPLAGASNRHGSTGATYVDPYLMAKADADPNSLVNVIIESDDGLSDARNAYQDAEDNTGDERMRHEFRFVSSVAVTIKAKKVLRLSRIPGLTITSDSRVKLDAIPSSNQVWPTAEALRPFYSETDTYRGATPTIAIVDSGIQQNRLDFEGGARVIGDQVITRLVPNSAGRRPWPRHVRGRHRRGLGRGLRRSRSTGQDRLARRHGRQRHGADERRDRGGSVDLRAQEREEHSRRELLAPLHGAEQLHERPARQGGREALVRRRHRGRRCRQLRQSRRPERRDVRARQRSVRDHGRRGRPRRQRQGVEPRRSELVGLRLHATTGSASRRSRQPAATWSGRSRRRRAFPS